MLEADDSERACIPTKLQLANFCQLRKAEIGQLLPVVRGSRQPDALQGRAIATIRVPLTLVSVLHGAEMSSISDLSEYQAINAFYAY